MGAGRPARRQGLLGRGHGRDVQPGRPIPTTARACSSSASSRTGRIIAYALNQTDGRLHPRRDDRERIPQGHGARRTSPRAPTCGRSATTAATAAPRRWTSRRRARTPDASPSPTPTSGPPACRTSTTRASRSPRRPSASTASSRSSGPTTATRRARAAHRHAQLHGPAAAGPDAHADADADADAARRRPPTAGADAARADRTAPQLKRSRSSSPSRAPTPSAAPGSSAPSITLGERADLTHHRHRPQERQGQGPHDPQDHAQGRRRRQDRPCR